MSKLEILIRQNKRKKEIENCKNLLIRILNIQITENDFLSFEQTDLLTTKFYNSYKISDKQCNKYLSRESQSLDKAINDLCTKFYNKNGYLITKQTEICGLINIPIIKILENYKQLIELDGDSLCILKDDETEGVYIDYFEETNEYESSWYYEVCFWKL